jgi:hypothetical protein
VFLERITPLLRAVDGLSTGMEEVRWGLPPDVQACRMDPLRALTALTGFFTRLEFDLVGDRVPPCWWSKKTVKVSVSSPVFITGT